MKRMLLLLVICLGVVFGSDPSITLTRYGIDVKSAQRAITDCYIANKDKLRPMFEINIALEAAKAAKAGRKFTIGPEYIMTAEETYDITGELCMDTEEGLKFGLEVYTLLGGVDGNNPDTRSITIALDIAKFVQQEFYEISTMLNGDFRVRDGGPYGY